MLSASVASVLYILCNFHQCSKPKFPCFCTFFATIPTKTYFTRLITKNLHECRFFPAFMKVLSLNV